jgi:hypothetical protein
MDNPHVGRDRLRDRSHRQSTTMSLAPAEPILLSPKAGLPGIGDPQKARVDPLMRRSGKRKVIRKRRCLSSVGCQMHD